MPATYELPASSVTDLLDEVLREYHPRLENYDIRIGVLMAHAPVDEHSGQRKGHALKGHAGAPAAAQIKAVALKDRITKKYDVELIIDGDHWPELTLPEQTALLDHELTHIRPTGKTDDQGRPIVKMREEDFIVWGFFEVVERHGSAALESKSVKNLMASRGQLLLEGMGPDDALEPARKFVDSMRKIGGIDSITITSGSSGKGMKITKNDIMPIGDDQEGAA